MSAIIVDDTDRVIGIQAWFLMRLLDFCVDQIGAQAYLADLRKQYERGYNFWDLRDLTTEQSVEFSNLIKAFISQFDFTSELIGYRAAALEMAERIDKRCALMQPN